VVEGPKGRKASDAQAELCATLLLKNPICPGLGIRSLRLSHMWTDTNQIARVMASPCLRILDLTDYTFTQTELQDIQFAIWANPPLQQLLVTPQVETLLDTTQAHQHFQNHHLFQVGPERIFDGNGRCIQNPVGGGQRWSTLGLMAFTNLLRHEARVLADFMVQVHALEEFPHEIVFTVASYVSDRPELNLGPHAENNSLVGHF